MKIHFFEILLILMVLFSIVLESSLFSIPLFLISSIILFMFDSSIKILIYIFISSLLIDSVHVQNLGTSGLFVLSSLLLLSFYKKNFEIGDYKIIIFVIFFSAFLYSKTVDYNLGFIYVAAFISIIVFVSKTLFIRLRQKR